MRMFERVVCGAALAILLPVAPAMAQLTWEAGVKGGVGLGKLTGNTEVSESETTPSGVLALTGDINGFRAGFSGGGFATARINSRYGVQVEFLFIQKGGKGDLDVTLDGSPQGTSTSTFKMDYFEIPILAVGSFPAGQKAFVDLFAGPAIAFTTAAKLETEFMGQSDDTDIKDDVKGTDFGIAVGAGLRILAHEKVNIVIDGRWTFGLTKFPDVSPSEDLKNNSLDFMAGLSFPLTMASGS